MYRKLAKEEIKGRVWKGKRKDGRDGKGNRGSGWHFRHRECHSKDRWTGKEIPFKSTARKGMKGNERKLNEPGRQKRNNQRRRG